MKRILLFLLPVIFISVKGISQPPPFIEWNFNSNPADGNTATGTTNPSTVLLGGTNLVSGIGNITTSFAAGSTVDPAPALDNSGYQTTDYPLQGAGNKTAGIEVQFKTTGYKDLILSFDHRNSTSAANTLVVQYLVNGVWTDLVTYTVPAADASIFRSKTNILIPNSLNNLADARLRIVTAFAGASYTGTSTTYAPTGTIRFDMISIKGTPLTCSNYPTRPARYLYLVASGINSVKLGFNRGNGGGCIVVCKQGSAVDANPTDGIVYTAGQPFGSGTQIGSGNYVVYSTIYPGYKEFTVTNLTPGVPYYFAVYEFSTSGFCYLNPPLTGSFYANATVLLPGDMLITAYDNAVASGGVDRYYLTNLKDMNQGTQFLLVNSRFESGKDANSRNLRWYGSANDPYQNPASVSFVYTGSAPIIKGSVIKFDVDYSIFNVKVNGIDYTSFFSIKTDGFIGSLLSGSAPDQVYLAQGYFTPFGTTGVGGDRYNILAGSVLHGISNGNAWVPFNQYCSNGASDADRVSRIPPQINCINMAFPTFPTLVPEYAYYTGTKTGSKSTIIAAITSPANWSSSTTLGSSTSNDIPASGDNPFTITASNADGYWTGAFGSDWYNCSNWEGKHVPEQLTSVTINTGVPNFPIINSTTINAPLYDTIATCRDLNVNDAASLRFEGSTTPPLFSKERLYTWGKINLSPLSNMSFANAPAAFYDTLFVEGELNNLGSLSFNPGLGAVVYSFNIDTIKYLNTSSNRIPFYALGIVNPFGVKIGPTTKVDVTGFLGLINGVVDNTNGGEFVIKSSTSVISLTQNVYGELDNGNIQSFVTGKLTRESSSPGTIYKFPIGKLVGATPFYAPCAVTPANGTLKTYTAEYFPSTPTDIFNVANPPLDHISQLEYWDISCSVTTNPDKDAKVTLYWSPYSKVGPGPLADLRIAHYYDDDGISATPVIWNIDYPGSATFTTIGTLSYGTIINNAFTTSFSPFTFGSLSINNVLPVQLLSWQATPQNKQVKLQWQVLDENEVASYTIEKSSDGRNFSFMQQFTAFHNAGIGEYIAYDTHFVEGWNYYRLIIVNKQGKTFTSTTQKAWMGNSKQLLVYPNPASNLITVVLPGAHTSLALLDASGKKVWGKNCGSQRNIEIDVQHLPRGLYLLQIHSSANSFSQKIMLR